MIWQGRLPLFLLFIGFAGWTGMVTPQAGLAQVDVNWNGGFGNWSSGFRWSGGNVPNNGITKFRVHLDNGNSLNSRLTLDQDATIDELEIDAGDQLVFGNGSELSIEAGVLSNDGGIQITGTTSITQLILGDNTQITGNGRINMYNSSLSQLTSANDGDAFTIGSGQTVWGRGRLGSGLSAIQNDGVVVAAESGILTVEPGTGGFVNNNLLTASGGGTLWLTYGDFENAGGSILADDGGTIEFLGANIHGGMISQTGSGSVQVRNGITNTFSGSIENHAAIQFNGTSGSTVIRVQDGTSFLGTGSLELKSDTLDRIQGVSATDSLINGVDHSIVGAGNLGMHSMQLTNYGLVHANRAGQTLTVDPGGLFVDNFGTMLASDGGVLRLNGGVYRNAGEIRAEAGSVVRLMEGAIFGGQLETTGDGLVEVGNGQSARLLGTAINNGTFQIGGVSQTTRLIASNNSRFEGTGSVELTSRAYSRLEGAVNNAAGHTIFGVGHIGIGSDIIQNYGTIATSGVGTLSLDATFQNSGQLDAGQGTLEVSGPFNQISQSAVTRINGGSIDNTVALNFDAGSLEGNGVISGDVVLDRAVLRPGLDGIGSLRFGSLDITSFLAATEFEIGGPTPGTGHDFIQVDDALNLHGELHLSFVNGFEDLLTESDQLTLMTSSLLSGYFTNVANGGTLLTDDGLGSFQVHYGSGSSYDPHSVVLSGFRAVPEPTGAGLLLIVSGLTLMTRRRRSSGV